jgi:hypothetical protein
MKIQLTPSRKIPCFLILLLPLFAAQTGAWAEITLPEKAEDCVKWAAGDVRAELKTAGVPEDNAAVTVTIVPKASPDDQSFSLTVSGSGVTIQAGGAVGAMYGLQELAEQLRNEPAGGDWTKDVGGLTATEQHPYLEIRADNSFIHVYPLLLNRVEMWRPYIDLLARSRYNMLDLHGAYDLQVTQFPNLYPMLVHVPDYPNAGNEQEQAKNLASMKAIIAYAKSRGVKVAFMNYSANNSGLKTNDFTVKGVPREKLADYTAKAVALLIKELPDLYMLGFRVGESSQPASFFKDAYIKGVKDAGRQDLRLYTRSWQTTKEQLVPIAEAATNGFDIEIKYNGEQLGLPYQSMEGAEYGSYSYQAYLDVPAAYRILWQVRANGTHRFWTWENSDFIRRTVRTFTLGNALGFTLEPLTAYFTVDPSAYYRSAADQDVYPYIWGKYWMWYFAWGRLSYNPDLPEKTLVDAFQQHYGTAGKAIYDVLQSSSKIVPLVYAYRFVGPDQRNFSPETETGIEPKKKRDGVGLLAFAHSETEDERTFASIDDFVQDKISQRPDGRLGPFEVARMLTAADQEVRDKLANVPPLTGKAAAEWRLMKTDILSASLLGDYYAARIKAMTYIDYAVHSGSEADYQSGTKLLDDSRDCWGKLASEADAVFAPLSNPMRKQLNFQWGQELPKLTAIDATAPQVWASRPPGGKGDPLVLSSVDLGQDPGLRVNDLKDAVSAAKESATIICQASAPQGVAKVVLWWKPLPSELTWQNRVMSAQPDGSFSASLPLTPEGLMYMVEVQDKNGLARNFPDERVETPYHIIPAFVGSGSSAQPAAAATP